MLCLNPADEETSQFPRKQPVVVVYTIKYLLIPQPLVFYCQKMGYQKRNFPPEKKRAILGLFASHTGQGGSLV